MKVLIFGVSGMLGNTLFRYLSQESDYEVFGTIRSNSFPKNYHLESAKNIMTEIDAENQDSLENVFSITRPDVVINCIGHIKQLDMSEDPLVVLPINSLLPHKLARLCKLSDSRLIHISTDCVFSGDQGDYKEGDYSDAKDLYGRSKFLGEVSYPHCITLRTSIIGHEIDRNIALIDWFLSQKGPVRGYKNVTFSGLPTVELARVIMSYVLPRSDLFGLYHVASNPINKYDLLKMVAKIYEKDIQIIDDETVKINRSLNAKRFNEVTGYMPPDWFTLIKKMHDFR
jgi:dTDP-4-dehydrorhamnose reductase